MNPIAQYYENLAFRYDEDRFGNSYGRYVDNLERSVLSSILDESDPEGNLEIACGTGRFLDFAHTGIDISKNMLRVAREKHPHARLIHTSFDSIPLDDRTYNNIYAFHLLMHLNESDARTLFAEAMRLLKDDGRFIIDVPSHFRRRFSSRRRDWHGSYAPQIALFEHWGWKVSRTYPIMFIPIHRVPKRFRRSCLPVEKYLSTCIPTCCASYMVLEMRKAI